MEISSVVITLKREVNQLAQVNLGSFTGLRFKESREIPYPSSRIFLSLPLDQVRDS